MNRRTQWIAGTAVVAALLGSAAVAGAQNATTGTIGGVVRDAQQGVLPGAAVVAVHAPTGTRYEAFTRADGRFDLLNVQVGPYDIEVAMSGFGTQPLSGVVVTLGEATEVPVTLQLATLTETVEVVAEASEVFSPARSGTTAGVATGVIETLPTIERSLQDFARVNPFFVKTSQNNESESFLSVAGRSGRYNNIQIDGAVNNDLFGLGAAGDAGRAGEHAANQPRRGQRAAARGGALRRAAERLLRRRHQRHHPERLERLQRHRLLLQPQRGAGGQRHRRRAHRHLLRPPAGRQRRRPAGPQPGVLLRQLREPAARDPGGLLARRVVRRRLWPAGRCAAHRADREQPLRLRRSRRVRRDHPRQPQRQALRADRRQPGAGAAPLAAPQLRRRRRRRRVAVELPLPLHRQLLPVRERHQLHRRPARQARSAAR